MDPRVYSLEFGGTRVDSFLTRLQRAFLEVSFSVDKSLDWGVIFKICIFWEHAEKRSLYSSMAILNRSK